jgi:predicted nuclease with TOPRIM domain
MEQLQKQIDYLTEEDLKNKQEIENLKKIVEELMNKKDKNLERISFNNDNNNKEVSIIISKYKKSLLIKNMYSTRNTTIKCKDILKELGAKWSKIDGEQGWIFVGSLSDGDKSLEFNSKFIVERLEGEDYKLEIKYDD